MFKLLFSTNPQRHERHLKFLLASKNKYCQQWLFISRGWTLWTGEDNFVRVRIEFKIRNRVA